MADAVQDLRISHLEQEVADLAKHIQEIEAREREKEKEERNRLLSGIAFLGGVILTLVGLIWNYRENFFR